VLGVIALVLVVLWIKELVHHWPAYQPPATPSRRVCVAFASSDAW